MTSLPGAGSASTIVASDAQERARARDGILTLAAPLALHFGGVLKEVRLAWKLVGNADGPLVLALGGISAGRFVTTTGTAKGWWHQVIGSGAALDTNEVQVLGIDFIGGSGESTGPERGQTDFPSISAYDQAEAIKQLLDHLQLARLDLLIGASYGGMVGLALAERYPERIKKLIVISAAHRSHPMSTAWRSVQRAIVRYAAEKGDGPEGLRLARALAMATYRSTNEFERRFAGEPQRVEGRYQFPVESYLLSRGDAYAATYIPEAFVCLSESIDLHRIDPANVHVPTALVGIREDQLVPIADLRELAQALAGPAELVELSSLYGHDAFLKEAAALRPIFAKALQA
jgi:homoserine O-acetyltransferase